MKINKRLAPPLSFPRPMLRGGDSFGRIGNLVFTEEGKEELLLQCPSAEPYIREYYDDFHSFIEEYDLYCLWLENCSQQEIDEMPEVKRRIERHGKCFDSYRRSPDTYTEYVVGKRRQPVESDRWLVVRRAIHEDKNIPVWMFSGRNAVLGEGLSAIVDADFLDYALLSSEMHKTWCFYLNQDSVMGGITRYCIYDYNTFPIPQILPEARKRVELLGEAISKLRTESRVSSGRPLQGELDSLYRELDREIDLIYGGPFRTKEERIHQLLELYQELTK